MCSFKTKLVKGSMSIAFGYNTHSIKAVVTVKIDLDFCKIQKCFKYCGKVKTFFPLF